MPRKTLALMATAGLLSACSAQGGTRAQPAPVPPSSQRDQGTCGAEKVGTFVGIVPTPEVLAEIKTASGAQTIRVVGPHDVMTMDFRSDRLTISTGDDGKIARLRCV
jgi:hypothetical protein